MITAGQLIGILSAFPKDHWVMFTGKDGPVDFDPHCIQEFANRLIIEAPNDQKLARELDDSEQRIEELKERIEELEAGIDPDEEDSKEGREEEPEYSIVGRKILK